MRTLLFAVFAAIAVFFAAPAAAQSSYGPSYNSGHNYTYERYRVCGYRYDSYGYRQRVCRYEYRVVPRYDRYDRYERRDDRRYERRYERRDDRRYERRYERRQERRYERRYERRRNNRPH